MVLQVNRGCMECGMYMSYLQISVCDVLIMKILQTIEQRAMERIVQRMRSPCPE